MHLKGLLGHAHKEAEVRTKAAQVKYDELHARFIELEEKFEIQAEDAKRIAEEHAAYEQIICRNGGVTIASVEASLKDLLPQSRAVRDQFGASSRQYKEIIAEVKKLGGLYQIVADRHPRVAQILGRASSSTDRPRPVAPTTSRHPSTAAEASTRVRQTTIVDRHEPELYDSERRSRQSRGRGSARRSSRGSARQSSRGRSVGSSRGRGGVDIDSLLNNDFADRWLNFSRRPSGS